jgi:hypothetical protein
VPVGPDNVRDGYDVPSVSKWLDFINLGPILRASVWAGNFSDKFLASNFGQISIKNRNTFI